MKKILTLTLFLISTSILTLKAQSKVQWAEKTAFHSVMSTTFHPAEEGNLEPIKKRSLELVNKAEEWKKSKAPEEYATKAIKKNLKLLVKESKALHKMIQKNASDAEIKAALFKLHDRFHTIAEICNHQNGEEH